MDRKAVEALLCKVASGSTTPAAAAEALAVLPYADLGFARLDTHRSLRQGFAEVIFCPGKTADQVAQIASKLRAHHELVIATRAEKEFAAQVLEKFKQQTSGSEPVDSRGEKPDSRREHVDSDKEHADSGKAHADSGKAHADSGKAHADSDKEHADSGKEHADSGKEHADSGKEHADFRKEQDGTGLSEAQYLEQPRALVFGSMPAPRQEGPAVCIVTAGTADMPVAEEVALLVVAAGYAVRCLYDVGVAGVHRLLDNLEVLRSCEVTVVIAGMDGALASFVGGLMDKPVIAVPTSVGYGASFGGLAALLSMLSSCAPGVTVVNIDNGFGAAMAALRLFKCLK